MLKKIDLLIIRAFIGPFVATFFVTLFALTMQYFWLYIDDLVGKGLDLIDVLKLIYYVILVWVPLALPIAFLISSIMVYGNLGETFELIAMKAAGISLIRIFMPVSFIVLFVSIISFIFSNNIIPYAQLKLVNLQYDIIIAKPALDIKEGTFYDKIDGYVLKIGKKEKNDSIIKNVIIFEKNNVLQDNFIIADSGVMRVSNNKLFIEFVLYNGWRYQERGNNGTIETDFTRLHFKEFKKLFSISNFKLQNSQEKNFYDPKLMSVRQLIKANDSFKSVKKYYEENYSKYIVSNFTLFANQNQNWQLNKKWQKQDTIFSTLIPDSLTESLKNAVFTKIQNIHNALLTENKYYNEQLRFKQLHLIELNKKFSLAFACLVMFLIGAPLGAIIKKGGFGTPLIFAIGFFVIFHLLNTSGEKLAKSTTANVFLTIWFANIVFLGVGFILIYKSLHDSTFFKFEKIQQFINKFKKKYRPLQ